MVDTLLFFYFISQSKENKPKGVIMEALIMGIATAFNILVLFKKAELHRYADAFCDGALLVILSLVFGNTLGGMLVATVASAIISVYFMFNPPDITKMIDHQVSKEDEEEEAEEDTQPRYKLVKPLDMRGL